MLQYSYSLDLVLAQVVTTTHCLFGSQTDTEGSMIDPQPVTMFAETELCIHLSTYVVEEI